MAGFSVRKAIKALHGTQPPPSCAVVPWLFGLSQLPDPLTNPPLSLRQRFVDLTGPTMHIVLFLVPVSSFTPAFLRELNGAIEVARNIFRQAKVTIGRVIWVSVPESWAKNHGHVVLNDSDEAKDLRVDLAAYSAANGTSTMGFHVYAAANSTVTGSGGGPILGWSPTPGTCKLDLGWLFGNEVKFGVVIVMGGKNFPANVSYSKLGITVARQTPLISAGQPYDFEALRAGVGLAHEISHSLGLIHSDDCAAADKPPYGCSGLTAPVGPYIVNFIADDVIDNVMFWIAWGGTALTAAQRAVILDNCWVKPGLPITALT